MLKPVLRDILRLLGLWFPIDRNLGLCSQLQELVVRSGTVSVGADKSDSQPSFREEPCELYGTGCLARSLYPYQHELPEGPGLDLRLRRFLADELRHFFVEHFYNVIASGNTGRQFLFERAVFHCFGQLKYEFYVDVSLQKRPL